MTNKWAVVTAIFINYFLGFSIIISPEEDVASNIGPMPGLIILISIGIFISDIQLIPIRLKKEYNRTFFVLELILTIFLCEFFMIKIWTRIETFIFSIIKFLLGRGNLFDEMGGTSFMSLLISGMALSFLLYAISATDSTESIVENVMSVYQMVENFFKKLKTLSLFRGQSCQQHAVFDQNQTAQIYHCVAEGPPIKMPYVRNPQCPLHGDHEVNHRPKIRKMS